MNDMVWAALALMRLAIKNEQLEQELAQLRDAGGAGTASSSASKPDKAGSTPDPATTEQGGVPGQ